MSWNTARAEKPNDLEMPDCRSKGPIFKVVNNELNRVLAFSDKDFWCTMKLTPFFVWDGCSTLPFYQTSKVFFCQEANFFLLFPCKSKALAHF
jgi:hypothetical protein